MSRPQNHPTPAYPHQPMLTCYPCIADLLFCVYICLCACVCVCMGVYVVSAHVCACMCMLTCMCVHVLACVCVYMRAMEAQRPHGAPALQQRLVELDLPGRASRASHRQLPIRFSLCLDPQTQPLPGPTGRSQRQVFFLPWVCGVVM